MTRTPWLAELKQDMAYAIRMLRRAPAFTAVAVVTLALGVGANAAIFSVVHGVLLQSLPFRDADRLVRVRTLYPDGTPYSLSSSDFASIRQDSRAFDRVEGYATAPVTMLGVGDPQEVQSIRVTDGLFEMLGFVTVQGRPFRVEEHQPGRAGVAILDHGFWVRQFGGASVQGRTVTLAGRSFEIIGVLREGSRLPTRADLYVPVEYDATFSPTDSTARRSEFLTVIGHAKAGLDEGAIEADLRRIGSALQTSFPNTNNQLTFTGTSLRDTIVGDVRTPLLILLGAVGFVLLVACANVANLLLARGSARQEELAIRAALGASRQRVFRQLLTESVVLSLIGGGIGLALAFLGTRALVAAQPADIPRLNEVGVSLTVIAFTFGVSILTGIVFGLIPAVQGTGRSLIPALRESGRSGGAGQAGRRVRGALVIGEIALAVVLLTGAGLLIRSFFEITRVASASAAERTMTFRFSLQGDAYQDVNLVRTRVGEIEAALNQMPGVEAVAAATIVPLGTRGSMIGFGIAGAPPPPANVNAEIAAASVSPNYFDVVGVPLRRGRAFTSGDRQDTAVVGLINEAAVRRWFEGQDPLGRFVLANGRRVEVVGVVGDMVGRDVRQPAVPQLFLPYPQRPTRTVWIFMRTAADPLASGPSIRAAFRAIDPGIATGSFTPFSDLVETSISRPRFYTSLLVLFAGVALLLAAIGVFGVMNYAVTQRLREISIRLALGASAGGMLRMIVGQALGLAAAGAVLGIAAALALGRVIQSQLFGVTMFDPLTLGLVVFVLTASAGLASFLPARRASKLDPVSALKQ